MRTIPEKYHIVIVVAINLIIAFGYLLGNKNANATHYSSDQNNIITVCLKKDDPSLFPKDVFAEKLENVAYYTPFYIETIRAIAKCTHGDYVHAMNILTFICHIAFGILWYLLLFRLSGNFWLAVLISIAMRGIIWLPGAEYWGISDIWSLLPRVMYYAIMPLPFLLFSTLSRKRLYIAGFLIGLIFNFHPISGLGGILIFLGIYTSFTVVQASLKKIISMQTVYLLMAIFLGMLPFFATYFNSVNVDVSYDIEAYNAAFYNRIPAYFLNPVAYAKKWLSPSILVFFVPLFMYIVLAYFKHQERQKCYILLFVTALVFILPNISVYIERAVNQIFDMNIRMSFQLIRMQKLIILSSFISTLFLADYLLKEYKKHHVVPAILMGYILLLIGSKSAATAGIPVVSKEFFTRVLPNSLSVGYIKSAASGNKGLHEMLEYIKINTPKDALFYAPPVCRSGAQRSVDLDTKGASMIIEGNPARFIQWYQNYTEFTHKPSRIEGNTFLKSYGIDYVLVDIEWPELKLIHQIENWRLYKVN
ncbi:hypothetical protein [Kordia jejudonensis]|uniref:hypothetical protein n=1 Tax=Kordia jejudonensis TaxID=1348245 RepID=UPI000629D020|nr:hypothetical protein [Kordia jejudonensis]